MRQKSPAEAGGRHTTPHARCRPQQRGPGAAGRTDSSTMCSGSAPLMIRRAAARRSSCAGKELDRCAAFTGSLTPCVAPLPRRGSSRHRVKSAGEDRRSAGGASGWDCLGSGLARWGSRNRPSGLQPGERAHTVAARWAHCGSRGRSEAEDAAAARGRRTIQHAAEPTCSCASEGSEEGCSATGIWSELCSGEENACLVASNPSVLSRVRPRGPSPRRLHGAAWYVALSGNKALG